jgi:hypothetical protein
VVCENGCGRGSAFLSFGQVFSLRGFSFEWAKAQSNLMGFVGKNE